MLCYLAGPVDGVSEDSARGWREYASTELQKIRPSIATFSPPHAISACLAAIRVPATCEAIVRINEIALASADYVIANLNGPSFGTPVECLAATCPVIGFGELARMQRSVYQHRFAYLAADCDEAIRVTLGLFQEAEEIEQRKREHEVIEAEERIRAGVG